jgi:SAM-dependent methyltransferase
MTALTDAARLSGFRTVDADPDAAGLIAVLDEQAGNPAVRRLRSAALRLLAPGTGERILDVGCGTGDVTRVIAQAVGPTGSTVGLDQSALMLREARRRTPPNLEVEFRQGDVTRLDDDDGSFDGVYCERLLQHVDAPDHAVAELVRVARPDGRIVLIDSDWGMHAIAGADPSLTAAVLEAWADNSPNAWAGRHLRALLLAAGCRETTVLCETYLKTDLTPDAPAPFATMATAAVHRGAISEDQASRWLAQLNEAAANDRLLWAVTMFAVLGSRR